MGTGDPGGSRGRWVRAIVVASAAGLFLELALIRWVSCEVRVFAYCKNLVLIACFLGFGTGCFLWRRRPLLVEALLSLVILAMLIRLPWQSLDEFGPRHVTALLDHLPHFMIFREYSPEPDWTLAASLAFSVAWTAALFFMMALAMVPFGQVAGAGIARHGAPLRAYSWNVLGSLAGILAYTGLTSASMPPLAWFLASGLGYAALARGRREQRLLLALTLVLAMVFVPDDRPNLWTVWSSYQKLSVYRQNTIVVNNLGYQAMARAEKAPSEPGNPGNRFTLPFAVHRPPGRVLIVGAGAGNDAATALACGASHVTAVEIDREIVRLGRQLHPDRPYQDPRVEVVVDDARHFLKTTTERYDVIVFSHLDAHTLLSSFTTVRLDNYIYTVEAFREARAHLAPGGLLYVSYFSERPFIGQRLNHNLALAFGHDPVWLEGNRPDEVQSFWRNLYFLTGEPEAMASLDSAASSWEGYLRRQDPGDGVIPSTDDWPFLPLYRREIPPIMLVLSAAVLVLCLGFAALLRPREEPCDGRLFFLGAAFMLLEVHNVSRLALVFGTTWQVNAWVIACIMVLILLANLLCEARLRLGRRPGAWAAWGLFASLAAAWMVPLQWLVVPSHLLTGLATTVLLTLPIFFAAVLFADAFAGTASPGFALGWNLMGAVLGGLTETMSYVTGIPSLVLFAAAYYALALRWRPQSVEAGGPR